jgi:AraC-like DNA-binding protein
MLDCVMLFVTFAGMLLAMLQDRRRSVWPAVAAMIPFVALWGAYMAYPNKQIGQISAAYLLLLSLLFTAYMVFAIRQYGRWLNDNYADLENKRVWLILMVTLACLLLFVLYTFIDINTPLLMFLMHFAELVLFVLLLWRVETLPQLDGTSTEEVGSTLAQKTSNLTPGGESARPSGTLSPERTRSLSPLNSGSSQPAAPVNIDLAQIERLLNERCVAPKLYLKHDLSLQELAQAVGTNRYYLGQYFSRQSITYNTYINNLRINYFISRYMKAVAAGKSVVAQELADESGFGSYRTFSRAFTERMGQSVTDWMRNAEG